MHFCAFFNIFWIIFHIVGAPCGFPCLVGDNAQQSGKKQCVFQVDATDETEKLTSLLREHFRIEENPVKRSLTIRERLLVQAESLSSSSGQPFANKRPVAQIQGSENSDALGGIHVDSSKKKFEKYELVFLR